jgi:hypothetical protein
VAAAQVGAIVLAGFGNAEAFFFFLRNNRCGHQGEGHQGSGSSSNHGTLVHLKTPRVWLRGTRGTLQNTNQTQKSQFSALFFCWLRFRQATAVFLTAWQKYFAA